MSPTIAAPAKLADAIRALAMDAVQQANSGHPGAPMGMAEMAEALFTRHLRHNPADPAWPNRDRFVLSNGHGSMLIYALLHLTGYDLPMEELRKFRQLHSKTPGHPEVGMTSGVETTTGPWVKAWPMRSGWRFQSLCWPLSSIAQSTRLSITIPTRSWVMVV